MRENERLEGAPDMARDGYRASPASAFRQQDEDEQRRRWFTTIATPARRRARIVRLRTCRVVTVVSRARPIWNRCRSPHLRGVGSHN